MIDGVGLPYGPKITGQISIFIENLSRNSFYLTSRRYPPPPLTNLTHHSLADAFITPWDDKGQDVVYNVTLKSGKTVGGGGGILSRDRYIFRFVRGGCIFYFLFYFTPQRLLLRSQSLFLATLRPSMHMGCFFIIVTTLWRNSLTKFEIKGRFY